MKNPLERVKELIPILPKRDIPIVNKYLEKRDFGSILEIVESDLYKANKVKNLEGISNFEYIGSLTELRGELLDYMSYLNIPDDSYDYDYY